jgi:hypothetical protein
VVGEQAMTEEEWLTTTDTKSLLNYLKQSDRKLKLLVSTLGQVYEKIVAMKGYREALELVERSADEAISSEILTSELHTILAPDLGPRHTKAQTTARNVIFCAVQGNHGTAFAVRIATGVASYSLTARKPSGRKTGLDLIREIFGNPFRPVTFDPSWLTSTVLALAIGIYSDKAFDRLPILADALQDAGCDNDEILNHLRQPGEHCRGCWALDLILGKS